MSDRFYGRWVLANGWSEALGLGTTFLIGTAFAPILEQARELSAILLTVMVAVILGVMLEGLLVGAAQAFVLRRRLPRLAPRRWIYVTMIGAGLAWLMGMVPSTVAALSPSQVGSEGTAPPEYLQYALAAGLGAIAGPILGSAQWIALRRHVPRAGRWLWANALAWAVGMPVIFAGMDRVPWEGTLLSRALAIYAVCGLAGAAVGGIHGAMLTRMVPRPSAGAA